MGAEERRKINGVLLRSEAKPATAPQVALVGGRVPRGAVVAGTVSAG